MRAHLERTDAANHVARCVAVPIYPSILVYQWVADDCKPRRRAWPAGCPRRRVVRRAAATRFRAIPTPARTRRRIEIPHSLPRLPPSGRLLPLSPPSTRTHGRGCLHGWPFHSPVHRPAVPAGPAPSAPNARVQPVVVLERGRRRAVPPRQPGPVRGARPQPHPAARCHRPVAVRATRTGRRVPRPHGPRCFDLAIGLHEV